MGHVLWGQLVSQERVSQWWFPSSKAETFCKQTPHLFLNDVHWHCFLSVVWLEQKKWKFPWTMLEQIKIGQDRRRSTRERSIRVLLGANASCWFNQNKLKWISFPRGWWQWKWNCSVWLWLFRRGTRNVQFWFNCKFTRVGAVHVWDFSYRWRNVIFFPFHAVHASAYREWKVGPFFLQRN